MLYWATVLPFFLPWNARASSVLYKSVFGDGGLELNSIYPCILGNRSRVQINARNLPPARANTVSVAHATLLRGECISRSSLFCWTLP